MSQARNATFLFYRNYMDYHADRFEDFSLMFYVDNHLHSILPANIKGDTLYSHQGLTYGGLVMNIDVTASDVVQLFRELNDWLRAAGISRVVYKPVPWVYHQHASEEDLYPLFWICNAKIVSRDIGTVIFMQQHLRWRKDRRRRLRRAKELCVEVRREDKCLFRRAGCGRNDILSVTASSSWTVLFFYTIGKADWCCRCHL